MIIVQAIDDNKHDQNRRNSFILNPASNLGNGNEYVAAKIELAFVPRGKHRPKKEDSTVNLLHIVLAIWVGCLLFVALGLWDMAHDGWNWAGLFKKLLKVLLFLMAPFFLMTLITSLVKSGFWFIVFLFMAAPVIQITFAALGVGLLVIFLHYYFTNR